MMEQFLANHAVIVIIVAIVCILIGRYLWPSKEDLGNLMKDLNKVSAKVDNGLNLNEQKYTGALNNLQLKITTDFGKQSEKMRIIQKETMDEADKKYFSKEMANQHTERIENLECMMAKFVPRMEKIDLMYDMLKNNKYNK